MGSCQIARWLFAGFASRGRETGCWLGGALAFRLAGSQPLDWCAVLARLFESGCGSGERMSMLTGYGANGHRSGPHGTGGKYKDSMEVEFEAIEVGLWCNVES